MILLAWDQWRGSDLISFVFTGIVSISFITNPRLGGPHRWWGPGPKGNDRLIINWPSADVMWVGGDVTRDTELAVRSRAAVL